jgi:Trm5-related predicted tRNA methylase
MQLERVLSSGDLEKGIISSSGNHREFLRLGEEITELDKIQDNAFEDEIMMFESSEDNLKKVQEIIS